MTRSDSEDRSRRFNPATGFGPFSYRFRPGPGGRYGAVFIRGLDGAPPPSRGDVFTLAADGGEDVDFMVEDVASEDGGWWANCHRRAPSSEG